VIKALLLWIVLLSYSNALETVAVGTGGVSGTYFPTGGSICRLVNHYKSETNLRCVVESTDGSVYNLGELRSGGLELGIAQSDIVHHAYRGTAEFDGQKFTKLRTIMAIYPELLTLVTRADTNIKKLSDIKGKVVSIGAKGSGSEASVQILLDNSNIPLESLGRVKHIKSNQVRMALEREQIDAYFYMVGHPTVDIKKILHTTDISIIPLKGNNIDKLVKKYPYYAKAPIKGGMYKGIHSDIQTYGVKALLVTTDDISDKVVYTIVKSVLENFEKFKKLHPAYGNITKKSLLDGLSAPLHNGAKKYYKEIGILK
jgi:TRAP transporter TAXI family solute receptor